MNTWIALVSVIHAMRCPDPSTCSAHHRLTHQLTRHAYPGQPSHRAQHVVQPCRCTYRLGGMYGTGSYFVIHPTCPHHGHLANTHLIERMWENPYEYGVLRDPYDLDDDERRD